MLETSALESPHGAIYILNSVVKTKLTQFEIMMELSF